MVLENTFLIEIESNRYEETAKNLLGIEGIRNTKVVGVHDLPENIIATIYPESSGSIVDVYKQIEVMKGVLGIRPLGKTMYVMKKEKMEK